MEVFLKLILFWIAYFVIHSVFASDLVKAFFSRNLPYLHNYYRMIYVFFATIGLLIIFIYQSSLPQIYFYNANTAITFLGLSIAAIGLIIVMESFTHYDTKEFLGIKQMKGNPEEQGFLRQGILVYIRHPLYSGSILLLIGYLIFAPSIINLITAVCMILYFIIGSYFEERKLIKTFGEDYLKYKDEVPPFIPHITFPGKRGGKAKN